MAAELGECDDARVRSDAGVEGTLLAEDLAAGEVDDEYRQVVDVDLGSDRDHPVPELQTGARPPGPAAAIAAGLAHHPELDQFRDQA